MAATSTVPHVYDPGRATADNILALTAVTPQLGGRRPEVALVAIALSRAFMIHWDLLCWLLPLGWSASQIPGPYRGRVFILVGVPY
jgi:hypothetical protein